MLGALSGQSAQGSPGVRVLVPGSGSGVSWKTGEERRAHAQVSSRIAPVVWGGNHHSDAGQMPALSGLWQKGAALLFSAGTGTVTAYVAPLMGCPWMSCQAYFFSPAEVLWRFGRPDSSPTAPLFSGKFSAPVA